MAVMDKPIVVGKMHKYLRQFRKNGNKVGRLPSVLYHSYLEKLHGIAFSDKTTE